MYAVYIIKSLTTGKYYIGQTQNIQERLHRHNSGRNPSTRGKGPWKLVFMEQHPDRQTAWKFEHLLKCQKRGNGLDTYLERWPSG